MVIRSRALAASAVVAIASTLSFARAASHSFARPLVLLLARTQDHCVQYFRVEALVLRDFRSVSYSSGASTGKATGDDWEARFKVFTHSGIPFWRSVNERLF